MSKGICPRACAAFAIVRIGELPPRSSFILKKSGQADALEP